MCPPFHVLDNFGSTDWETGRFTALVGVLVIIVGMPSHLNTSTASAPESTATIVHTFTTSSGGNLVFSPQGTPDSGHCDKHPDLKTLTKKQKLTMRLSTWDGTV